MLKKFSKQLLIAAVIVVSLVVVRLYQAPVNSGAVLDAFIAVSSTPAQLKLVFFTVGQGDAALVIAPNGEDILVDGGPDNTVVQKLGEYLPYTDRKIEHIVLTHPHADHLVGLIEVLNRYEVGEVIMTGVSYAAADYQKFKEELELKNIPVVIVDRPQLLQIADLDFEILAPPASLLNQTIDNLNNSSIVFRLVYSSTSAMFAGDFEAEESLLNQLSTPLKSDVLKVGHHGSTNANSRQFLTAISPLYAVISVGAGNSYNLPGYRTIFYLNQLGAKVFRTDLDGDVSLISDGSAWRPTR